MLDCFRLMDYFRSTPPLSYNQNFIQIEIVNPLSRQSDFEQIILVHVNISTEKLPLQMIVMLIFISNAY